jgi:hypothetical protein
MAFEEYNGVHEGERLFILGNGPSLGRTPLHLLNDKYTLAMNKIDKIFPETEWRPTYYLNVVTNPEFSRLDTMRDLGIMCFFRDGYHTEMNRRHGDDHNVEFLDVTELNSSEVQVDTAATQNEIDHVWSDDISDTVYRQHSSIYTAAQVAYYMGFDELCFLGCDLYPVFKPFPYMIFDSASDPNEYKYSPKENKSKLDFIRTDDKPFRSLINGVSYALLRNPHFIHPLYELYDFFDLTQDTHVGGNHHDWMYKVGENEKEKRVHRAIQTVGENKGFETYNPTLGGQLEVYERVDLTEIVDG